MKGKVKVFVMVAPDLTADPDPADVGFKRVNKIKSLTLPEESVATSEKTYLDQDSDYTDHDVGMTDGGEAAFSYEYIPADEGQLIVAGALGQVVDMRVEWVDGRKTVYRGTVTKRAWGEPTRTEDLSRSYSLKMKREPLEVAAGG